jgi:hypothetical protein
MGKVKTPFNYNVLTIMMIQFNLLFTCRVNSYKMIIIIIIGQNNILPISLI